MLRRSQGVPRRWRPCSLATQLIDSQHMSHASRDRLGVLLAEMTGPEVFSAALTAPTGDLCLQVRGVGPIKLPVSQAQARQLCLLGRPARYGQGERTVLDRGVRDTWEIPKSRVKIDKRRWNETLLPVLERLGRELGLPSGRTFRAELHSMLIYAPGQFFLEHQDSEKDDAMLASLVVSLPSTFKGGALEVRHGGQTATYRGSKKALSFVAFYSDCRHQVKPVASGYRVALTYNLLLHEEPARSAIDPDSEFVDDLTSCLEEHFGCADNPDFLVYLLDHEYTPRGLSFSRLKGADAQRAPALRAAAERAGCEVALALTTVRETWSAYEENERDYRGWDGWDDEDESDSSDGERDGDYDLEELIESEVTLESWTGPRSGRLERVSLPVGDDTVCASTPSEDMQPYTSEYEGYMGNYGNTLDRWYRRGAVVLWPRSRAFAVRARASPPSALQELSARARTGDLAGAREAAATLAPFWEGAAARVDAGPLFAKALRAAELLDEPALATMLLRPFRLELLTSSDAEALSALVRSYGERWGQELVTAWSAKQRFYHATGKSTKEWTASLPKLCIALRKTGETGAAAALLLLGESWGWAKDSIERALDLSSPSAREQTLSELARPIAAVLEGARVISAANLSNDAIAVLRRDGHLKDCAIAVLRATPKQRWSAMGLDALAADCSVALEAGLARPPRAGADWSIKLPNGCGCELCAELRVFLEDPIPTSLEWPLAKDRRAHIHRRIDASELPVDHQTRRTGRPYTLLLRKTDALFQRERRQRRQDERHLAWLLTRNAGRPSPAGRFSNSVISPVTFSVIRLT
jgi:2OG-Fe(II) oxygenase superfamily